MPLLTDSAAAIGLPVDGSNRPNVSNAHRRVIMQAAHRTRRALGMSMADALRKAWAAFRKARLCHWPLDQLIMPHERKPLNAPARIHPAYQTRDTLRLSRLFAI
jgi:hypothetical protein